MNLHSQLGLASDPRRVGGPACGVTLEVSGHFSGFLLLCYCTTVLLPKFLGHVELLPREDSMAHHGALGANTRATPLLDTVVQLLQDHRDPRMCWGLRLFLLRSPLKREVRPP